MDAAVFLDRDGTLIHDKHYLGDPEEVEFFPGVKQGLKHLHQAGYELVVVTNQSGVARGLIDETDVERVHRRLRGELADAGVPLAGIYYCPYLEQASVEEYRRSSRLRKPAPGMLETAARQLELDCKRSYMVGDKASDVEAGHRAGCTSVLVRTGKGEEAVDAFKQRRGPEAVVDDFADAAAWILDRETTGTD